MPRPSLPITMENRGDEEANAPLLESHPAPRQNDAKESLWNRLVWKNGVVLVSLAALWFAAVVTIVKRIEGRIPEFQILWVRGVFISVGAPLAARVFNPGVLILGKRENLLLLGLIGVMGCAQLSALCASVMYVPVAESLAVLFTNSIVTAALAGIMGLDKWSRATPVSVVLSVVGVLLVTRPAVIFSKYALVWDADRIKGLSFAAASSLCISGVFLLSRKLNSREGGLTILWWQCFVLLVLSTASLAVGVPAKPVFRMPVSDYLWTAAPGVLGAIPWVLLYRSVQLASATVGSVMVSTQLLWSYVFDLLFFGEPFSVLSMAGCLCILGGSAIVAFTVIRVDKSNR